MTGWTETVGWTLLHFVWEGTLTGLLTAAVLRSMRRASARARYVAACAGLFATLSAPPVTAALLSTMTFTRALATRTAIAAQVPAVPPQGAAAAQVNVMFAPGAGLAMDDRTVGRALSALVVFWCVGVLLLSVRLVVGWYRVRRLHAAAIAGAASAWLAAAERIASRLGLMRAIRVIDSLDVETPTVIGWLRPVVLLPVAALANLTPAQVEAVLAHELAHVRRHDFVVNLLQTIAETLLFYHPAVWWMSSRIRIEREHCCDDIAVQVCGDAVGYAEALTTLAAWAQIHRSNQAPVAGSQLALAATGGSLLDRVRRVLRIQVSAESRRPKAPLVIGATVVLVLAVGFRLMVAAQTIPDDRQFDRRLGPMDINAIVGFQLFPGPVHYATDDPQGARSWDVMVVYPDGQMVFKGFTGRSLIRHAFALGDVPVLGGPDWIDRQSISLRAETSTVNPQEADSWEAIRAALVDRFGITVQRDARLFPVYGLQTITPGALGPNIRPATADCVEDIRERPGLLGPSLHARGQVDVPFCGVDNTFRGPIGYRVTLAEFARHLRGFNMKPEDLVSDAPEVVDQTGLTGVYDFELNLGFLPLAAIASVHPNMAVGFGPMIRTFPQAMEEQLGLRLVRSEAPRDVAVVSALEHVRQSRAVALEHELAAVETR